MLRFALARLWQVVFGLLLLAVLATTALGGAQAQRNTPQLTLAGTQAVSPALAKKPTQTPTRKLRKTKTPTPTTVSPPATETPTAANSDTPTLPPGIYHLNGTLRALAVGILTWRTPRGTFDVALTPTSQLTLDGKRITVHALEKGQRLDGLVRADAAGKLTALTLTMRRANQITAHGKTENSPVPEADTNNWSTPLDLDAGINTPQVPLLAAESASGSAVVWYADSPQPGLYFSVHIAESDQWTEPQFLAFTSAADYQPRMALDYQRQLHLVWEHADTNGTQIRYAAATLDPVNFTFSWNEPVTLSDATHSAVNATLAVSDWNAQPRVHVVWLEAQAVDANTLTWNLVSRHADSPALHWSAPFIFGSVPSAFAQPALAATYGKVAVAYMDNTRTTYRECDLAAAQGDCGQLDAWSSGERATRETPDTVGLALDTGGNAHLVWRGTTDTNLNQIVARRRDATGHWSAPFMLRQLPADTAAGVVPLVTADTSDQVYAVWKVLTANGPQIEYAHFDGMVWSLPLAVTTQTRNQNDEWGGLVMDSIGALHVLWRARGTKLYYAQ